MPFRRAHRAYRTETAEKMIAETNRFLSMVLRDDLSGVREELLIPRRRVSRGGFNGAMRHAGTRALIHRFWSRMLNLEIFDRSG